MPEIPFKASINFSKAFIFKLSIVDSLRYSIKYQTHTQNTDSKHKINFRDHFNELIRLQAKEAVYIVNVSDGKNGWYWGKIQDQI